MIFQTVVQFAKVSQTLSMAISHGYSESLLTKVASGNTVNAMASLSFAMNRTAHGKKGLVQRMILTGTKKVSIILFRRTLSIEASGVQDSTAPNERKYGHDWITSNPIATECIRKRTWTNLLRSQSSARSIELCVILMSS